jgi:acetolactate synthase regulatory subunit
LDNTQLLAISFQMRSNAQYQAAETLRRSKDVAAMAKAARSSADFAAVNLLVNTWETISLLILQLDDKDLVFQVTPVLHMFTELSDAIEIISADFPDYAANFRLLSKQQLEWLKFKDERYQSGAKGGMHALFG